MDEIYNLLDNLHYSTTKSECIPSFDFVFYSTAIELQIESWDWIAVAETRTALQAKFLVHCNFQKNMVTYLNWLGTPTMLGSICNTRLAVLEKEGYYASIPLVLFGYDDGCQFSEYILRWKCTLPLYLMQF